MAYTKPQLDRLERINNQEYNIICFLRNYKRKYSTFKFVVSVDKNNVKCKELVDNKE